MQEKLTDPADVKRWEGSIPVRHRYTPGVAGEVFFAALRDRGVILGSRCEVCGYTYVPARMFCERCFAELSADAEVGPGGTLESFAVGFVGIEGEPLDAPITVGLIRLDGADAVLFHFVMDGSDDRPLEIGQRVGAVLKPAAERVGSILDIAGFRPA
ncbi:MAG: Zn-ribbon domain-containing OB-fold protein [Actinobacteria bacterium]|nr:Zn-ribbon domain-containing OB-fold protein [Actinomycetota bacterium]